MANPKEKAAGIILTKGATKEEKKGCDVRPCSPCLPHEYQDKKYGQGKRVKNFSKKEGWGCTICGKYEKY